MTFKLPDLPYDYAALEPYIDAQTMQLHHDAHHDAYVKKLNEALAKENKTDTSDIIDLLQSMSKSTSASVRNNGGGHYNHSLFWKWMTPVGSSNPGPTGDLKSAIEARWGSVSEMQSKFNEAAAARFGSGWAWLGVRKDNGELDICSTANQDNPLMKGVVEVDMVPVLGLDVWEHAYYLKYQNRRAEYIQRWWNVVNWDTVVQFYDTYVSKGKPVPL